MTYTESDQLAFQEEGPRQPLAGWHTLESFSELLDRMPMFPDEPQMPASRFYRRWAFESAALDLALRQAELSLAEALDREPRPVTFVASFRLGDPPTTEPLTHRLALYPWLKVKLDPSSDWDLDLIDDLGALRVVATADLKGAYKGTVVDQPPDPELYRLVAEGLPDAWIEDPALTPETDAVLEPHRDRITWDAPIHSVGDIEGLGFAPKTINMKPSRFGSVAELLSAYDYLEENGIGAYGGGQYELGPGRGQIQYLASLFHPDMPNDVAPSAWNEGVRPGLPESPLAPAPTRTGFRWE